MCQLGLYVYRQGKDILYASRMRQAMLLNPHMGASGSPCNSDVLRNSDRVYYARVCTAGIVKPCEVEKWSDLLG